MCVIKLSCVFSLLLVNDHRYQTKLFVIPVPSVHSKLLVTVVYD